MTAQILRFGFGLTLSCSLLLGTGCFRRSDQTSSFPGRASEEDPAVGRRAPALSAPSVDGKELVSIEGNRGQIIVAHFWSSKEHDSRASLGMMESLFKKLDHKIEVIGISVDDDDREALAFANQNGVSFSIVSDPKHLLPVRWGVKTVPTTFIIDAAGIVRHVHHGQQDRDGLVMLNEIALLIDGTSPLSGIAHGEEPVPPKKEPAAAAKPAEPPPEEIPSTSEAGPADDGRGKPKRTRPATSAKADPPPAARLPAPRVDPPARPASKADPQPGRAPRERILEPVD